MLTLNPKKRISAHDALMDPWIQKNQIKTQLKPSILENLGNFQTNSRFRHAVMTFMASMLMNKQEEKELLAAFQALDLDGNGVLTIDELIAGYKKLYPNMTDSEIQGTVTGILNKIDVNGSGEIDFTEFVVATMNQQNMLNSEKIKKAFSIFDLDGDGFIDRGELKAAMGGVNLTDKEWDKLIGQYDTSDKGKVSLHC